MRWKYQELTLEEYERKEKELKEKITPEFLATLREALKFLGGGDYGEVVDFYWDVENFFDENKIQDERLLDRYWVDYEMLRTPVEEMSYQELQNEWFKLARVPEADWSRRCRLLADEMKRREDSGQRQ